MRKIGAGVVVVVAVLSVLLSGCTGEPAPDPPVDPTPDQPVISDPVGLPGFTMDAKPLWGSQQVPVHPEGMILRDDVAVVVGTRSEDFPELRVVDADTGKARWSLQPSEPIPGFKGSYMPAPGAGTEGLAVVGEQGREVVVVKYYYSDCLTEPCPPSGRQSPESGVVGLDLRTGEPRWHHAAVGSVDEQDDPERADRARDLAVSVVGGHSDRPLVVVGPAMALNGEKAADSRRFRTDALDPGSGRRVWTAPKFVAAMAGAGTVLGFGPSEGSDGVLSTGHGTVSAIDVGTGRQRWTLADRLPDARILAHGPRTLVLSGMKAEGERLVVDTADGSVDHALGATVPAAAVGDDGLVVYHDPLEPDDRILSVAPQEEQASRSGAPVTGEPTLVWDGYVFVHGSGDDTTTVVDRAGTVLSDPLRGRVIAVTDDRVVLQRGAGDDATFTVHAH